ncbi:hypothetical protein ACFE04_018321 [Oxalis oulophora]
MSFVERNGTHFIVDGKVFYVNGWNSYWLMEHAVDEYTRPKVKAMLKAGAKMGLSRLIFAEKQLEDDRTLADYNIHKAYVTILVEERILKQEYRAEAYRMYQKATSVWIPWFKKHKST